MRLDDPTQLAEWRAIALECKLTRQLCGAGLTSIGRANYADGMGEYYSAFFSLSVGIERLCKLIVCFVDEQKTGRFPSQAQLRGFGHDLSSLFSAVGKVASEKKLELRYGTADDDICTRILTHLSEFAKASAGRYANFSIMERGSKAAVFEPLFEWQRTVGEEILQRHFRGTASESKARGRARLMDVLAGPYALVRHTSEDGTALDTLEKASFRTAENQVHQKYGRYYAFRLIRWLAEVFSELTRVRGYEAGGELWFGHYEHFNTFTVPNEFGLTRKVWPLT